jgi:glycosyltransferase involved in cell wall biosynthesis
MRILLVHETCGWQGGVEQNITLTTAALRAHGHRVVLASAGRRGRDPDRFAACFDSHHDFPGLDTPQGEPAFRDYLTREPPDVVYLHKLARLPWVLLGPRPFRTVRMVHDHDLCCPRRHRYFALSQRICRHRAGWRCWLDLAFVARPGPLPGNLRLVDLGAHLAELRRNRALDALLVGSRWMRDDLVRNGFAPDHVQVLAPTLPAPAVTPGPSPADGPLLFVGQLVHGKGVDLLLRALARVAAPWRAVLVGEGNARPALEALAARLGLADRVEFVGWVDHARLDQWYAQARLVVVPSRWPEPFGMVGLEAMQRARPVVAFNVGGVPDWCQHGVTGLLVPQADVAGLGRAIARLLEDHQLAEELGRAAREAALARFGFQDYVTALERALAGERGRS